MADFVTLSIVAITTVALVFAGLRRRAAPNTAAFILLILALAEWSLAFTLGLATTDLPTQVLSAKSQYVGLAAAPTLWLILALHSSGRAQTLTRPVLVLLGIVPLASLLLVWTNDVHHLVWDTLGQAQAGAFRVFDPTYGPAFWVHSGYSYLCLAAGAGMVIWTRADRRIGSFDRIAGASGTEPVNTSVVSPALVARNGAEPAPGDVQLELQALNRLSRSLLSSVDVDQAVNVVLRTIFDVLPHVEDVHVWLYQSEHLKFLTSLYADGRSGEMIAEPRPDGLTYKVARSGEALVVPDIRRHPLYVHAPESWRGALAALPLKVDHAVVGVITAAYAEPHEFAPDDIRVLRPLADQVAILIDNVRGRACRPAQPSPAAREPVVALPAPVDEELEHRVRQRTAELTLTNAELVHEMRERQRAEEALRQSETRYALAARGANDGLWDWDLLTNHVYYSPRWKAMVGCADGEVGESPDEWFKRVHPEDMDRLKADLMSHLEGRASHFENEHRMRYSDGNYRWMLSRGIAVQDESKKPVRLAGSQTDITRRKVAEERLLYDALHEPLTGLPNRALFMDRLAHVLRSSNRRAHRKAAVLFLDLDRFKVVNDSLGHMVGDHLLIAIAKRLEACVRPNDTVARFGGDEFGILLDDINDTADADRTAERVLEKLSAAFEVERHVLSISASIGIALVHRAGATGRLYESPEDILRDADTAMYRAKALGRARYEVFNAGMHARAVALLMMEADLRQALAQEDFELFYQPIVSVSTGRVTCVEALVRWRHAERGLIAPAEFIPLAEETGLIVGLGEWILRSACRQIAAWRAAGHPELRVAVNVSARQFQDPNLIALVRQMLAEFGLPGAALEVEITESTTMSDVEQSQRTLTELNAMGVQLSIDDFGNSYSTLGYLTRFPFKTLKIDQSFVRDIVQDATNAAITTAITAMARSLKLRVIAEGIETEEQLTFLRAQRCDEVQGFLLSRPLTVDGLTQLLKVMPPSGAARGSTI